LKDQLREYITRDMMGDPKYPLRDDEGIMSGGLIDSFSLVTLALFIEEKFGVHIPDPELTVANMDTLDKIVAVIERKKSTSS
jgi:acyl carrier protein